MIDVIPALAQSVLADQLLVSLVERSSEEDGAQDIGVI
jgi:hypothetical protein